jgi:senataxin
VQVGRDAASLEKKSTSKILLCAPSNAAIDEIASRITLGFRGSEKVPGSIRVVRLGAKNAININVQDISLDALVEKKLDSDPNRSKADSKGTSMEISALRRDIGSLKQAMALKQQEGRSIHDNLARKQALNDEISQLRSRKMSLSKQLDNLIDKDRSETRTLDALRRKTRVEVINEADVVCSTLSGAGHELLAQFDFEMVIIDEAAQAIELSSLIPLKYRSNRCVMVGDPQQLPPTVLSQEVNRLSSVSFVSYVSTLLYLRLVGIIITSRSSSACKNRDLTPYTY